MKKNMNMIVFIATIITPAIFGLLLLVGGIITSARTELIGYFFEGFGEMLSVLLVGAAAFFAYKHQRPVLAITILVLELLPWAINFPRSILYNFADFQRMTTWIYFFAFLFGAALIGLLVYLVKTEGIPPLEARRSVLVYLPVFVFAVHYLFAFGPITTFYHAWKLVLPLLLGDFFVLAIVLAASFVHYPFELVSFILLWGVPRDAGTWLEWIFGIIFLGLSVVYFLAVIKKITIPFVVVNDEGGFAEDVSPSPADEVIPAPNPVLEAEIIEEPKQDEEPKPVEEPKVEEPKVEESQPVEETKPREEEKKEEPSIEPEAPVVDAKDTETVEVAPTSEDKVTDDVTSADEHLN